MNIFQKYAALLLIVSNVSIADMPYLSLEERKSQAVAIISGEIVSIVSISFAGEKFSRKIAVVKIKSVEKGDVQSAFILVSIGKNLPENLKNSQTIQVNVGDGGKWILNQDKTDLFVLNRPENFTKTID